MSLFKKLFGGSEAPKGPEPTLYNGYTIIPEPMKEPDGYRIAARIEKEIGGEIKSHHLMMSDNHVGRQRQPSWPVAPGEGRA